MEYVLQTDNLKKRYGKSQVLNGLTMNIPKGAVYGFVGKNGAGKTTLIRLICGLQKPTDGSFSLFGVHNDCDGIVASRRRIAAIIETPAIYMNMTAEDNLKQQYIIRGLPSYNGISELLKLVGLENTDGKKVKRFSLGMKQRLGIAIALVGNPEFVVLDEPINGLDPQGIIEIREMILKLNIEYKIISKTLADIFAKLNITQLTMALAKENCEVLSINENGESLENYFISLVGGKSCD